MYTTILHATDLGGNHFKLCQQALKLAQSLGADIHFLHVIEPPASLQLAQGLGFTEVINPPVEDVVAVMRILGEALNIPVSHQHVETGSTYQNVLKLVSALACDLVILGSHSDDGLPAFLGSTAHSIIHHAPCDVLTIKTSISPENMNIRY